jgi:hypothetical protein
MRTSPSIAPQRGEQDTYLVLDEFGRRLGRSWRESKEDQADRETVISNLLKGEYNDPIRVVAFNTVEGWSRDVTMDIADELRQRFIKHDDVSDAILPFLEANRR